MAGPLFYFFFSEGPSPPLPVLVQQPYVHRCAYHRSMYYHFCLLCAFRPFVGLTMENTNIQPHEICTQAAKSVLSLAQSYDDLFTLRRVSGFIPYFITASGLFSLGMEDAGSRVIDMYPRSHDNASFLNKAEMKEHEPVTIGDGIPVPPSHVKVSVVAHSRLLLAKMSTTHPAAAIAERMLEREIELKPGSPAEGK